MMQLEGAAGAVRQMYLRGINHAMNNKVRRAHIKRVESIKLLHQILVVTNLKEARM